jgi:hypothetical protein
VIAPRAREASVQISPLSPYGLTTLKSGFAVASLGGSSISVSPTRGQDCEAVGGWHRWQKSTEEVDGCYHCEVTRRRSIT